MGRARDIANLIGGATPDIILKTSDGAILNLQTSDTTVTQDSVLGAINFQAPDEADGTDAILVASKIEAIAEGTFNASSNATSLVFSTANSEAAGSAGVMTFTSGGTLKIKDANTSDGSSPTITLQTGDTDIAQDDVLGSIEFQAPDEGTGTDAILVAAGIAAVSEGDFSSSSNATKLSFKTGASEAAAEKMSLSSAGLLTVSGRIITDDTTDATSTTDGSLQTDGGLSVAKDAVIGDDLLLLSDSAAIKFGADSEITLTHSADSGLLLKHAASGDDKFPTLNFQAGDTDIAQGDVLGRIAFQAPDEGAGTDAITVPVNIEAVSQGDFSSSNNATSLVINTSVSAAVGTAGDGGKFSFVGNGEQIIKSLATSDGNHPVLSLQTGETDLQAGDIIGFIGFQAPDEATGGDANLICAAIAVSSEGDFSSTSNASMMEFRVGSSETATEKFRIESSGSVGIANDGSTSTNHLRIGASADYKIFHDGTDTKHINATGTLRLETTSDSAIMLRHNDNGVMETDANGIIVNKAVGSATVQIKSNTSSGTGTPQLSFNRSGTVYGSLEGGVNSAGNSLGSNFTIRANAGDVFAIDSSSNSTQLSPHNFDYIPDGASETGAWCYKSDKYEKEIIEKDEDGNIIKEKVKSGTFISADMTKVVRQVEKLTGEKLIYKGTLDVNEDGDVSKHNDDGSTVTENIIDELMAKIETLTQRCDVSEGITIEGILLDGTDGSATDAGSKILLG